MGSQLVTPRAGTASVPLNAKRLGEPFSGWGWGPRGPEVQLPRPRRGAARARSPGTPSPPTGISGPVGDPALGPPLAPQRSPVKKPPARPHSTDSSPLCRVPHSRRPPGRCPHHSQPPPPASSEAAIWMGALLSDWLLDVASSATPSPPPAPRKCRSLGSKDSKPQTRPPSPRQRGPPLPGLR